LLRVETGSAHVGFVSRVVTWGVLDRILPMNQVRAFPTEVFGYRIGDAVHPAGLFCAATHVRTTHTDGRRCIGYLRDFTVSAPRPGLLRRDLVSFSKAQSYPRPDSQPGSLM
jgi:hypothetical protein